MTTLTLTATADTLVLAPRLSAALELVSVRADGLQATVAGREITTESPRDLRGRLANALYEEFHAGNGEHRREPGGAPRRSLRDASLEERLAAGVPHAWTPTRARLIEVLRRDGGDQLVVRLPDITARVPADRLIDSGSEPQPGDIVELALEAARPALSPGFFYVMGSRALPRPAGPIRRLFLHALDGDGAAVLWAAALAALEEAGALYHAKALSDPDDFPRRDGLVVYLHGDHVAGERAVVEAVRDLPGRGADSSLFTERLAPGVAAAWDPRDPRPGRSGMSFGQHRSFALATALVDHATADSPAGSLEERVAGAFRAAGIDPLRPENNITTTEGN
ncbi:T3SS effector HopA1 family protein [Streptomyces sp. NBC_00249]|uniref:T3SS effector HopA1 family protein n=1 Tax=Streptomyces sp. NBC_00249 TaxID=2975690 RepID=UPI002259AFA7|nr:T3SS effector HopA1 family protein [Streptomyces sp. NBC_00249]MCX5195986.1 T3SS effector HopA1 family protein [Streptomyces sp. NBC_00249]